MDIVKIKMKKTIHITAVRVGLQWWVARVWMFVHDFISVQPDCFQCFKNFIELFSTSQNYFQVDMCQFFFVYTISNPSNKWYFIVTFYLLTYEGLIFRWRIQGFAKMNPILLIPFPSYWSEIKSCIHTDNVLIIPFWWRIGYKKSN